MREGKQLTLNALARHLYESEPRRPDVARLTWDYLPNDVHGRQHWVAYAAAIAPALLDDRRWVLDDHRERIAGFLLARGQHPTLVEAVRSFPG